jgi:hypothetical protein
MYFYAITRSGWRSIAAETTNWLSVGPRPVVAYVGTDHALTEPDVLDEMLTANVQVRLMRRYHGIYHPKVIWFVEGAGGRLLGGSNNLTGPGLKQNIEFATLIALGARDPSLDRWHQAIHAASDPATSTLIDSYRRDKARFDRRRARARVETFIWRRRSSGPPAVAPHGAATLAPPHSGDLVVEVMPLETGEGGKQIQIPSGAGSYFGLATGRGATAAVTLTNRSTSETRILTMTRFSNDTSRLVIRELDPRDRPCVISFRRSATGGFEFEIVQRAIDPTRYRILLGHATNRTRSGSRRWGYVP